MRIAPALPRSGHGQNGPDIQAHKNALRSRAANGGFRAASTHSRNDTHSLAAALKLDFSVNQGEKREIAAHAHALAGVKMCAHLTNDDIARPDRFAAVFFDATSLPIGITTIAT